MLPLLSGLLTLGARCDQPPNVYLPPEGCDGPAGLGPDHPRRLRIDLLDGLGVREIPPDFAPACFYMPFTPEQLATLEAACMPVPCGEGEESCDPEVGHTSAWVRLRQLEAAEANPCPSAGTGPERAGSARRSAPSR